MASMEDCGDRIFEAGKLADIFITLYEGTRNVKCLVTDPSGAEVPSWIEDVEDTCYEIQFVPQQQGTFRVSLTVDGEHIEGSPQDLKVEGDNSQTLKITATGKGLRNCVVDEPSYFYIKAKEAGAGKLSVSFDGPASIEMKCNQVDEGTYKISYFASLAGMYEVNVRFAGKHIKNSPYRLQVKTAYSLSGLIHQMATGSHASQCIAYGLGLRRAEVGQMACFKVNISSAGEGSLLVSIGPQSRNEVDIKYFPQYSCIVHYTLMEEGDYVLDVLWGDTPIPGSPFRVKAWQKFPETASRKIESYSLDRPSFVREKINLWETLFRQMNKIDECRWKAQSYDYIYGYGCSPNYTRRTSTRSRYRAVSYRSHYSSQQIF